MPKFTALAWPLEGGHLLLGDSEDLGGRGSVLTDEQDALTQAMHYLMAETTADKSLALGWGYALGEVVLKAADCSSYTQDGMVYPLIGTANFPNKGYHPDELVKIWASACGRSCYMLGCSAFPDSEEGKRSALPHSRVMIHQPLGGVQGQASDIEIDAREILKMKKELYTIISDHSHTPYDKVYADSDRNYWMTAEEAKEYGMIDNVLVQGSLRYQVQPYRQAAGLCKRQGRNSSHYRQNRR